MKADEHKPSLKKNIILSLFIQVICYISPLIASPYLTRVLGAENIGIYSFSYSYAHYFILFASFGFTNYGTTIISENRADFNRRNELFWSLISSRMLFALFSVAFYLILIFSNGFVGIQDRNIMLVFTTLIVSAAIDFTFFFRGIEKLDLLSIATAIVNVFYLASIFIFVKNGDDLLLFTVLKTLSTALINVFLIPFLFGRIGKPKATMTDFKRITIGSFAFFLPTLVMGISASLDQTFIGIFSNNVQVAYYQQTSKITALLSAVLYAASAVILSRASLLTHEEDGESNVKILIAKSIVLCFFILSPVVAGFYLVGNLFIPLYFGDGFASSVSTFFWLLPVAIASSFSSVIISAFYYPRKKTISVTIVISISILINTLLTIVLLITTDLGAVAAAIGSLFAELFTTVVLFFRARSVLSLKMMRKDLLKILCSVLAMSAIVFVLNFFMFTKYFEPIVTILLDAVIGAVVYFAILLVLKENTLHSLINTFKTKAFKKRNKQEE